MVLLLQTNKYVNLFVGRALLNVPALDLFPEPVIPETSSREQLIQTNGLFHIVDFSEYLLTIVIVLQGMMIQIPSPQVDVHLYYLIQNTKERTEMLSFQV